MAKPGLRDRADRSLTGLTVQGCIWGSPLHPAEGHVVSGCRRGSSASLRNPAFSAVDCVRLQSALGRLGAPMGVPFHRLVHTATDPLVSEHLPTLRSLRLEA